MMTVDDDDAHSFPSVYFVDRLPYQTDNIIILSAYLPYFTSVRLSSIRSDQNRADPTRVEC